MKKLIALFLAVLMLTGLVACGTDNSSDTGSNQETAVATESESALPNKMVFGDYYGNSYNNTFLSIGISFPNDWTLSTASELAEINGMDETEMTTDFANAMEDIQTAYILNAADSTGECNANIIVENLKLTGYSHITGAEYIELTKENTVSVLEAAGATDINLTVTSVTIGDKTYSVQILSYTLLETYINQTQIMLPAGDFMAILTLTGDTETILNRIYPL